MHQGRGYLFKVHLSLYFTTAILQTCCSATPVTINTSYYDLKITYWLQKQKIILKIRQERSDEETSFGKQILYMYFWNI